MLMSLDLSVFSLQFRYNYFVFTLTLLHFRQTGNDCQQRKHTSQRIAMPYPEPKAILTDIGTEEYNPIR